MKRCVTGSFGRYKKYNLLNAPRNQTYIEICFADRGSDKGRRKGTAAPGQEIAKITAENGKNPYCRNQLYDVKYLGNGIERCYNVKAGWMIVVMVNW